MDTNEETDAAERPNQNRQGSAEDIRRAEEEKIERQAAATQRALGLPSPLDAPLASALLANRQQQLALQQHLLLQQQIASTDLTFNPTLSSLLPQLSNRPPSEPSIVELLRQREASRQLSELLLVQQQQQRQRDAAVEALLARQQALQQSSLEQLLRGRHTAMEDSVRLAAAGYPAELASLPTQGLSDDALRLLSARSALGGIGGHLPTAAGLQLSTVSQLESLSTASQLESLSRATSNTTTPIVASLLTRSSVAALPTASDPAQEAAGSAGAESDSKRPAEALDDEQASRKRPAVDNDADDTDSTDTPVPPKPMMDYAKRMDEIKASARPSPASRPDPFPVKLYHLLLEAEANDQTNVVAFTPCGTAFRIHDRQAFLHELSPQYFRYSKWSSFLRQLYLYEFEQHDEGPLDGAHWHASFQRGRPDLLPQVVRRKTTPSSSSTREMKANQPSKEDPGTSL